MFPELLSVHISLHLFYLVLRSFCLARERSWLGDGELMDNVKLGWKRCLGSDPRRLWSDPSSAALSLELESNLLCWDMVPVAALCFENLALSPPTVRLSWNKTRLVFARHDLGQEIRFCFTICLRGEMSPRVIPVGGAPLLGRDALVSPSQTGRWKSWGKVATMATFSLYLLLLFN